MLNMDTFKAALKQKYMSKKGKKAKGYNGSIIQKIRRHFKTKADKAVKQN
jgi:hypothetical protein